MTRRGAVAPPPADVACRIADADKAERILRALGGFKARCGPSPPVGGGARDPHPHMWTQPAREGANRPPAHFSVAGAGRPPLRVRVTLVVAST